jgi:hypothetical protein
MPASLLANPSDKQEPIYQQGYPGLWRDVTKSHYKLFEKYCRIVYAAPPTTPSDKQEAVNGIPATLRHDEGAIARCSYCGRYSLDPKTLSNRQPKCDCGEQHGWSGSFKKPGPDSKWSGAAPLAQSAEQDRINLQDVFNELREDFSLQDSGKALKAVERAIAKGASK